MNSSPNHLMCWGTHLVCSSKALEPELEPELGPELEELVLLFRTCLQEQ